MAKDFSISSKVLDTDKYVYREERDLSKTQVDWGTVSKELTTTINNVRDERETQKAEIEKANTESMNRAGEFDQYNSKSLNESVLEGSEWAKNAMSVQMDFVRRGLITPSENKRYQQRVSDSFSSLKGNLNKFAAHYDEAATRTQEGVSVIGEQAINNTTAGLANLGQYELSGNPATGELHYVHTGTNPKTGEPYDPNNPANQISLSVINSRMNQKMDYVATSDSALGEVDKLGEVIESTLLNNQAVRTVEDWRQLEDSEEMMDRMVGVIANTPAQKLSILQEAGYTAEDFTEDPNTQDPSHKDYDPSKILMVPNPDKSGGFVFEFNEEQEAEIEKNARLALEAQIDKKIKTVKGFAEQKQSSLEVGQEINLDEGRGYFNSLRDFVTGGGTAAGSGAQNLVNEFNKALPEGEMPYQQVKRVVDADGNIISFELTREDGTPLPVNVEGLSTVDAMRELWGAATPIGSMKWETLLREDPTILDNFPEEYGTGEASGQGQLDEYGVTDINSTREALDGKSPLKYIQGKLGGTLASETDPETQVKEVYENVISAVLPSQMFDDIQGSQGIKVSVEGNNVLIQVGESTAKIEDAWGGGEQDYTIDQLQVIEDLIGVERQRLKDKRAGRTSSPPPPPMTYAQWLVQNPGGTFQQYQDYVNSL
tara:strand:- start:2128 stop:4095 length:1968 start_codon:yes stop_codon:yes gene_type:complete